MSSKISDLYEISNLLFFSYFASQNKEITPGNSFFDVCCVNQNILVRRQVPTIINYFKTLLRRKSNGLHQKTLLKHDLSNELAGVQMAHLKKHM